MRFFGGSGTPPEDGSPADLILGAFTRSAREMHSMMGFPGVLILVAVLPLLLQLIPGYGFPAEQAAILSSTALASSVGIYWAERYSDTKRAEAQAKVLQEYIQLFVGRYLEGKKDIGAEE